MASLIVISITNEWWVVAIFYTVEKPRRYFPLWDIKVSAYAIDLSARKESMSSLAFKVFCVLDSSASLIRWVYKCSITVTVTTTVDESQGFGNGGSASKSLPFASQFKSEPHLLSGARATYAERTRPDFTKSPQQGWIRNRLNTDPNWINYRVTHVYTELVMSIQRNYINRM